MTTTTYVLYVDTDGATITKDSGAGAGVAFATATFAMPFASDEVPWAQLEAKAVAWATEQGFAPIGSWGTTRDHGTVELERTA